ncbi:autotransporter-associated beta strand repeat-containing protein [Rubritalea profundi]|uniref:Autotransporter domain-containing protein n=1 Tax=Rubritalea profundi TaxID=1658618 RepID=A0A2S7TZS6_9BACT|nr:autotransporter-associated beta strand repeat-containing protein [Rubritalea profundi]PQJ27582.1 hypothetical protein BSZ32_03125 [Rubritalea profundi]
MTVFGTQDIGGLTVEEGDVTLSGDGLRMTSDSVAGVVSGSTLSVSSVISNDSARQLAKGGDGTLTLSGANTYAGVTKLEAGTISVPSLANATVGSPLGNYPTAGADGLNLIGGTLQYTGATASRDRGFTLLGHSTLEVNTAGETLTLGESAALDAAGSLTVTGGAGSSLALGHLYVSRSTSTMNPTTASLSIASIGLNESYGGGALTFTLGGTATGNEVTGAINRVNTHPNNWDGCHDVIKEGSSVWTLSGNNNYNGKTIVNDGTLLVTGEIQQAASVAVNGPGVLGGTGMIKKATTANAGGGLAPGLSVGTLTFTNNLNFAAMAGGGGTLVFELDALAGTSDQIAVSGTLGIGQGALRFTDFTFSDLGGLEAGTYTLMTSGVISGWIDDTNDSGAIGSFTGTLQLNGNNLELVVSGLAAGSDYDTWADGYPGLTDASADLDFDGGGLEPVLSGSWAEILVTEAMTPALRRRALKTAPT